MTVEKPTSRAINVHLGELKEPWAAYCSARGLKPGAAIREAIARQLASGPATSGEAGLRRQADETPDTTPKEGVRVWLTSSEKKAMREQAEAEKCSMGRWIVDAIRTRLTGEPQFSMKEIETLGESNFQLLAIGRNLNQIARRLNEGKDAPEVVAAVKELRRQIGEHTALVDRAMRASIERWKIE